MRELRLGDQLVRYDRDATLVAYAQLEQGDAQTCGCAGCRNFIAAREHAFPDAFRIFLAELGIDPNKEGEAVHQGPIGDNLHFYEGWFYFVGELIEVGETHKHRRELPVLFFFECCAPTRSIREGQGSG